MSAPQRPTRGRTRPGRLRAIDAYLRRREVPAGSEGTFIDVGFGVEPSTTLETAAALGLRTVGVELDRDRAEAARTLEDARTRFICGGVEEARAFAPARMIRAMNVLRGYRGEEVQAFHQVWASLLEDGGLLVEGSTDTEGHVAVAHLLRRAPGEAAPRREALLFWTDFTRGFAPILFRDWLPRDLRRRVVPGEALHAFFARWTDAWSAHRAVDPPRAFAASVEQLRAGGEPMDPEPWLAENGYAVWRPQRGVPLPSAR